MFGEYTEEFLVKVIYKTSGHVEEFWVSEFELVTMHGGGLKATWVPVGDKKPVMLNIDEVAAIWQVATRKVRKGVTK